MNLQNLNLVELNAQEQRKIEGGVFPIISAVAGSIVATYAIGYGIGKAAYYLTR
ncbi:class IIb bacteriocin, lactobin A/cerein 7B family [Elizabethkingia anophelis]|uniref:class IIb bacteriocin, lactobin A/cerein 7B family n=1 Tax=Elizabethkingia anophelis TaxID=1117645 RepID=UPI00293CE3FB|nr:bacteriocin [Elizabethkingia anophelis]